MRIEVSRNEYKAAITEALEIIAARPESSGAESLSVILANVWDCGGVEEDVFECLGVMDLPTRRIGLCLVIGRTFYGRPAKHPRSDEVEALYNRARGSHHSK